MITIKMFTTPICLECQRAKRFFKEKGLDYEEIDAFERKEEAEAAFKKAGFKKIPLILIGEKAFPGFDKKKLEEHLP